MDGSFTELQSSPLSHPGTIQILKAVWLLVQSVTRPSVPVKSLKNPASNYDRARKAILEMPEITPLKMKEHIYECCRLFARLLLNAAERRLSLSYPVENHAIVYELEVNMRAAESATSWGIFRGVYFNVLVTGYIASLGTSSRRYFHRLAINAFGYYACGIWEGAYRPLATLKRFQDFCRSGSASLVSFGL